MSTKRLGPLYDHLVKILIIGDSTIGKTSLTIRFCDDDFKSSYISTIGIDFRVKTVTIRDKKIKVQVWDTAGQERFRTITTAYYRGSHGILLTYDVTNRQTFINTISWLKQLKDHCSKNVTIVLVANKIDLTDERQVSYKEGKQQAEQFGCQFFETSCKTGLNVDDCFMYILETIINSSTHYLEPKTNTIKISLPQKRTSTCCS